MEKHLIMSPQAMLVDLLLWHMLTKQDLAHYLKVPISVVNGMLFKEKIDENIVSQLQKLYQRVNQKTYSLSQDKVIFLSQKNEHAE